jgi:transposase-like protein
MAKPPAQELVAKIEEAHGNISAVARAYKRSRTAVYQWIEKTPAAKQALSDQRETVVDAAESVLFKRAIQDQELNALFYILNNMREAKDRGWGPRHEHTGKDGEPLTIAVVNVDTDKL